MAEKPFDIDSFIADAQAARKQALIASEAAKKAAAKKKSETSAANAIKNQAGSNEHFVLNVHSNKWQLKTQFRYCKIGRDMLIYFPMSLRGHQSSWFCNRLPRSRSEHSRWLR